MNRLISVFLSWQITTSVVMVLAWFAGGFLPFLFFNTVSFNWIGFQMDSMWSAAWVQLREDEQYRSFLK